MPTSFTTYYGDILHGVWITWFNDPNGTNGEQLGITYQVNAYGLELTAGFPYAAYVPNPVLYQNDINWTYYNNAVAAAPAATVLKSTSTTTNYVNAAAAKASSTTMLDLPYIGFGLSWANTDTASTVLWDGIEAVAYHLIETSAIESSAAIAPTWKTYWFDRTVYGDGLVASNAYWCFDLKPATSPTAVAGLTRDVDGTSCETPDNVVIVDATT